MTSRLISWMRMACCSACLSLVACGPKPEPRAGSLHPLPSGEGFKAGFASADITPALHLSLFGHGPEGRIAAGFRLRLSCRVFVVAAEDDVVALVPCDLQSPSMALQRGVAKKLRQLGVPITGDRLFIMATHTHAAPGHYFESRRYSGTFSSQAPGYDETVVEFLVGRISAGIAEAFANLGPACLGWQQKDVYNLTFNRAYVPFLANQPSTAEDDPLVAAKQAEQRLQQADATDGVDVGVPQPACPSGCVGEENAGVATGAARAVDPQLSVLGMYRRVSDEPSCTGATLAGVLAVFGMHPTGVPNTNDLYHGDIFGFAARTAEGLLSEGAPTGDPTLDAIIEARRSESGDPNDAGVIVGLANGVEGDVSPRVDFQSVPEARKHGRSLGKQIAELAKQITPESGSKHFDHVSWDLYFPGGQYDADSGHTLCPHAELGMAAAGGARDGPTRVRVIPAANAGFQPTRPSVCHGQKVPLRSGTGHSPHDFPQIGPIGLVRIGDGLIATVPGEVTTMTGKRIRQAIVAQASPEVRHIAIAGLTNQYFQYFATHEEYPFQFYEGASTLYGAHSEQFLVRYFGCLAARLQGKASECRNRYGVNQPVELESDPTPIVDRWPAESQIEALSLDPLQVSKRNRDGTDGWEMEVDELPLTFTSDRARFSVAVSLGQAGGVVLDDDRGSSIEVREQADDKWRIRWTPDLRCKDPRCGQTFRLMVRGDVQLSSTPFVLDCGPEPEPCVQ